MRFICIIAALLCVALASVRCGAQLKSYRVEVVREYPHDIASYTQGLFFHDGQMYESTGVAGESTFRKVDMQTGEPLRKLEFADKYFVEGSVALGDDLYILTWHNKVAFVYDINTLEYKSTWSYPREGWGLTTDGNSLIASDGSAVLYFMTPEFKPERQITVRLNGRPMRFLNELEYIDGKIWANVYTTDMILVIDPEDGKVEATIDCSGLLPEKLRRPDTDVLNGIAYNPADKKLYLTGKNWPRLYEVRIVEK